jgi:spermidine synthase
VTLLLLIIGFVSILGQVVILRELSVAFYGIDLIYILSFGLWLLWSAAGALIGRRRNPPRRRSIAWLFLLLSVLLPMEVVAIRWLRAFSGAIPGTYLPFGLQIANVILVLAPVGIVLGLLFQWTARVFVAQSRTLAAAYAIECAGGLTGGLAATLLLERGIQNFAIAILCGLSSVLALMVLHKDGRGLLRFGWGVSAALLAISLILSLPIDRALTRANHPDLVDTRDSPYSRITITRDADQFVVFENDVPAFETQDVAAEELVHLAALQCRDPQRVLVLGGGLGGVLAEILKHSPQKVDYVELNPILLALVRRCLPPDYLRPLDAPGVQVQIADPREFITGARDYDLILLGMPDPTSGLSNRFYTREFFARCAAALRRDGILAFRLATSENIRTRFLRQRDASIIGALRPAFRDIRVLPGRASVVIASPVDQPRDPDALSEELQRRHIATKLVTPPYIHYLYTNDRFQEMDRQLASTSAPPNTDTQPVCYRFAGMIWLSKFFPAMINSEAGAWDLLTPRSIAVLTALLAAIAGAFLLARRWLPIRRAFLVGVAGFIGMVLESGLILFYQVTSGALFLNVGILLAAVMAGLSLGPIAVLRMVPSAPPGVARSVGRKLGLGLLGGFVVVSAGFAGILTLGMTAGLLLSAVFLFVTGVLVSGVFSYASLWGVGEQDSVISPLYAADLFGGFSGALLGSLVLIPFAGLPETALMMLACSLAALLLIS